MVKRKKRGQGNLITTVLIVILVLAGVVIVWNVVAGVLNNSKGDAQKNIFAIKLTPEGKIISDSSQVQIKVHRAPGKGTLTAIKFLLRGNDNMYYNYTQTTNLPDELETKTYTILYSSLSKFSSNKIIGVQFTPSIKDAKGVEFLGLTSPLLKIGNGSLSICTANWTCGNWGSCTSGLQTRTCTDINNCGGTNPNPTNRSCVCTPGNRMCSSSNTYLICDSTGHWGTIPQSCSYGQLCDGNDGTCKYGSCKNVNTPFCEILTGPTSCTNLGCSWTYSDICEDNGNGWGGNCGNIGSDGYDSCGSATSSRCSWGPVWWDWTDKCNRVDYWWWNDLSSCSEVTTAYACEQYVSSWCTTRYANSCYGSATGDCTSIGDMATCYTTSGYCSWSL